MARSRFYHVLLMSTALVSINVADRCATAQTLDLAGQDVTLPRGTSFNGQGFLNGSDAVTNNGGSAATLTEGGGANGTTYSGAVSDGTAQTSLVHSGGAITLTGLNSYSGTTTVQAGDVQLGTATAETSLAGRINLLPSAAVAVVNANLGRVTETINDGGTITFSGTANAAPSTLTNSYNAASGLGLVQFTEASSAAGATLVNNAGATIALSGSSRLGSAATTGDYTTTLNNNGTVTFVDGSSAGHARLVDNASGVTTFAGQANAATASVDNNGVLSFTGQSSAAAATVVNNGSLRFSDTSTAGSAQIANNATATFDSAASAGSATLTTNGTGRLTFSGTSTAGTAQVIDNGATVFAGSSTAAAASITTNATGTLTFQDTAHAGTSTITNNGDLQFAGQASGDSATVVSNLGSRVDLSGLTNGGTTLGSLDGAGAVSLGGNVLAVGSNDRSTTLLGSVTDGGAGGGLTKLGGGTLVLGGQNTYTGQTVVDGGTLKAAASGAFASGSAFTVASGATLDLGGTNQTTASISGSGTIGNSGAPNAVLTTGANNASTIFSGVIQQVGLNKVGDGTLTLSGDNTYAGATVVSGGTLLVSGSIANSTVTLQNGGMLAGSGLLGALVVQAGSVLAPGATTPFTTLKISGNVTFDQGSIYRINVDPTGRTDSIAATGSATLNGGTVDIVAGGRFATSQRYTILTAEGGVTGAFSSLTATSNLAFLAPTLSYDATSVSLGLTRNEVDFVSLAQSANQRATARALQSLDLDNVLYNAVLNQSAAGARQAFDATSGEIHASAVTAAFEDAAQVVRSVTNRLDDADRATSGTALQSLNQFAPQPARLPGSAQGYAPPAQTVPVPASLPYALWGSGFGDLGHNGRDGNAAALDRALGGFVLGGDVRIDGSAFNNWRIGLVGGYTNDQIDVKARGASGSVETFFGGVYGGAHYGAVDIKLGVTGGGLQTTTQSNVAFPGFIDRTDATYGGSMVQGFGEIGYKIALGYGTIEPVLQGAAIHIDQDGFTERGGAAALSGFTQGYDVQTTTLGLRGESAIFTTLPLSARGFVGWRHAFGDVTPSALLAFSAGSNAFAISGSPIDRDAVVAEVGLDYHAAANLVIGVSYAGQAGQRAYDNAISARLAYRF